MRAMQAPPPPPQPCESPLASCAARVLTGPTHVRTGGMLRVSSWALVAVHLVCAMHVLPRRSAWSGSAHTLRADAAARLGGRASTTRRLACWPLLSKICTCAMAGRAAASRGGGSRVSTRAACAAACAAAAAALPGISASPGTAGPIFTAMDLLNPAILQALLPRLGVLDALRCAPQAP